MLERLVSPWRTHMVPNVGDVPRLFNIDGAIDGVSLQPSLGFGYFP